MNKDKKNKFKPQNLKDVEKRRNEKVGKRAEKNVSVGDNLIETKDIMQRDGKSKSTSRILRKL